MALIVKDRVLESSTSTGTGSFTLTGAQTGYQSFSAIGNGNTTYYTIQGKNPDGTLTGEWEVGEGTWSTGNTLARNTVFSNSLGTTAKIAFSAGDKDVFVTYPSDKALLGTTSAVASTGTGNVVLNNNPTFATDITVNGLTVGRGFWQDAQSSAFGYAALESPYGILSNTGMTGIGYSALSSFGVGIATVTVTNGGGGYYDNIGDTDTFSFSATLEYVSGPESTGVYPTATINVQSGVVTSATITDAGYGFPNTGTTVFTAANPLGSGDGLRLSRDAFKIATYNTALGYFAGSTNYTGSNSVYIGANATGNGSNEIIIGANAIGGGTNTVVIGDGNITSTILRGSVIIPSASISGTLSASGALSLTGLNTSNSFFHTNQTSGTMIIGGTNATGAITLGRSTNSQNIAIQSGATGSGTTIIGGTFSTGAITIGQSQSTQTVNIQTGANQSGSIVMGSTTGTGSIFLGRSTGIQTVNVATGATATSQTKTLNLGTGGLASSITNITIGSTAGTSTTTVNGYFKPPALASAPTYVKGAVYFDTTLNKLRVGGATTWETITSI